MANGEEFELTKVTIFFEGGALSEDVVNFYKYLQKTDLELLELKSYSVPEGRKLLSALLDDEIILRGQPESMTQLLCDLNPTLECDEIKSSKSRNLLVPGIKWQKYSYYKTISSNVLKTDQDQQKISQSYGILLEDIKVALSDLNPSNNKDIIVKATGYSIEINLPKKDVSSIDSELYKLRPTNIFVVENRNYNSPISSYNTIQIDKSKCEIDFKDIIGINAENFIDSDKLRNSPPIAIFEDNIDYTHCDFFDSEGKSIFYFDNSPPTKRDCNQICENTNQVLQSKNLQHGTHIAGIIGARSNNVGIIGVNPFSHLIAFSTEVNKLPINIKKAIDEGVKVANMSIGYTALGNIQNDIGLKKIKDSEGNILFIGAAGNTPEDNPGNPIEYDPSACGSEIPVCLFMQPNVLTVEALTSNGIAILPSSNRGAGVIHIAAPGENILSDLPNGFIASGTGTSQATAIVTGVASLLFALNNSISPEAVKNRLMYTADL
ncbi:MAG: S8 family serine peptidase, partial [Bacillota bacterium]